MRGNKSGSSDERQAGIGVRGWRHREEPGLGRSLSGNSDGESGDPAGQMREKPTWDLVQ